MFAQFSLGEKVFVSESRNKDFIIPSGWEDPEYRKCYENILRGNWEKHDAFDATHRVAANMDMYNCSGKQNFDYKNTFRFITLCLGGCSMFRSFQGWMSLSTTKPGGGTLKLCPVIKLSSSYVLLRPLLKDLVDERLYCEKNYFRLEVD